MHDKAHIVINTFRVASSHTVSNFLFKLNLQVLKVCCNQMVTSQHLLTGIKENNQPAKVIAWAATDYAEDGPKDEKLCVR